MARRGRPTSEVALSAEERETLERWARRPKSAQALALRCRIVLAAANGEANGGIAARLGCHPTTVGKWRRRFAERRLDGLHDEPRPDKPRSISDDDVERVVTKTLEETPTNATHWSTRSMAQATGMSQTAVSRIWRAFALEPVSIARAMPARTTVPPMWAPWQGVGVRRRNAATVGFPPRRGARWPLHHGSSRMSCGSWSSRCCPKSSVPVPEDAVATPTA
jgi:transposase